MPTPETIADTRSTTCAIVGGGPAGVILSLLLARQGIEVTLLEAHKDFDRDFRGDTIHPSTLELMDQLGLAEKLHQLPHEKMTSLSTVTRTGRNKIVDFTRLKAARYPYIMIMPQSRFLAFLAEEAAKYPSFHLELGANVQRLIEEDGAIRGLRYQSSDGLWHEVKSPLTIGADGRFSKVRKLAGIELDKLAPPMDVLWLRLPKKVSDQAHDLAGGIHIGGGHFAVMLERPGDEWQIGYAILKGSYSELKAQGIAALREAVAQLVPPLADRVEQLKDFSDLTVLSVEVGRVKTWHKPGLLLIGDAAHVMSPVGGIGIQYAVQDAVEAANQLAAPLKSGQITEADLARVEAARLPAVTRAQKLQTYVQQRIVRQALDTERPFRLPLPVRMLTCLPYFRTLPARVVGWGFHPSHLREELAKA
jgi:2-polyprenyl-6-methoxyphenol hydroxylase-like FAD-dependent oxidoreductase